MEVSEFLSKIQKPSSNVKLIDECISKSIQKNCKVVTNRMESFVGKILEGSCSKEMIILKKHEIVTFSPNDFFCVYLRHQKKDFRTDSEISKSKDNRRNLEEWSHEGPELTLETEDRNWDQFAINHEKFGVVSTYQEELYTTKKVSPSSLSKEQLKTAHEKEKQILKGTIKEVEEEDEEKLFSAVIGSGRFQESDLLPKRERATSMASSVEFFSKDEYKRTREYLMNPQKAKKAQTVADIGVLDALDLTIAQTNNEEIILSFYKFKQEKQQPSRQDILKDFQGFSKKLEGLETKVKAKNEGLPVIHEEEVSVINVFIKNWKSFASKNSTINN